GYGDAFRTLAFQQAFGTLQLALCSAGERRRYFLWPSMEKGSSRASVSHHPCECRRDLVILVLKGNEMRSRTTAGSAIDVSYADRAPLIWWNRWRRYFVWAQIIIVFLFLEITLWSPTREMRNRWALISAATIVLIVLTDRPSLQR